MRRVAASIARTMATQLPHLPEVERLSPSILRILGGNPSKFTLQGTNTYLLGREETKNRILIDTAQGFASWKTLLADVLRREKATVTMCLITHFHHDHIGGINDLKELCPGVEVWKFMPKIWDHGTGKEGESVREEDRGVREVEDGMIWKGEDGLRIKAVHCPGHTDDHCAFLVEDSEVKEEKGVMFTGDSML